MVLHQIITGDHVSLSGWTSKVQRAGGVHQGLISGEVLLVASTALSTQSLLHTHTGKQIMVMVLPEKVNKTLPAPMWRDLLQMIGNAFPAYEVVARNSGGTVSSQCPLCHSKLCAHAQMWCCKTKEAPSQAGMAAHDKIMSALLEKAT